MSYPQSINICVKRAKKIHSNGLFNIHQNTLLEPNNLLIDIENWNHNLSQEINDIEKLNKNGNQYLVAQVNNQIAGYCLLKTGKYRKNKHCGTLEIFVLPQYRKQKIGKKLVKEIIKNAKIDKLKRIEVEVWDNNKPALALYKKLGFTREGTKKKAYKIKNRYIDSHIYSKII